jgi:NADH:ubiquinone oxidoreductase subunit 3 (subunit A)
VKTWWDIALNHWPFFIYLPAVFLLIVAMVVATSIIERRTYSESKRTRKRSHDPAEGPDREK